jgi:hypothetical protein
MYLRIRIGVGLSLALVIFWHTAAFALEWEIERNFRYFLYPSDVAVQRVAHDLYAAQNGRAPSPEESELLINGEGFWTIPLARAGSSRERWPIDWQAADLVTIYDLVRHLRGEEERPLASGPEELSRLGWAVLLAEGRDGRRPTGFTATCWNPGQRLHSNCVRWGDYVRPPGWIVRVFDPQAGAGQRCAWTIDGGVVADAATPSHFQAKTQEALRGAKTTTTGDCREVRIIVPSDPKDPRGVDGRATVTRTAPDGSQVNVVATPRDHLVIGFGDSFTSGEGNPERPAVFTGSPWIADRFGSSNLPARAPDPTSARGPDTRAQWTDRWCHRSVYSWQIRSALDAALRDLHQSVTILPYGCSGATIPEGLLFEYNGVEWSQASDHGVIGSRAEIGLAYQEVCQGAAFRSPYCRPGDKSPYCGSASPPPSVANDAATGFYEKLSNDVRQRVARCGPKNDFKRSADALLLDIGINDVGFSSWVAGLILNDPLLVRISNGFIPCVADQGSCAANYRQTKTLFDRLGRRYALLRQILDQYLLPEFGIDPSHVIVPVYPPALENEHGEFCPESNAGLTVATFSSFIANEHACQGSMLGPWEISPFVAAGVISAYRGGEEAMRDVEAARVKLNASLAAFALNANGKYDVVSEYTPDFEARGVCATTDPASRPSAPNACFGVEDLMNVPCAPGDPPSSPESMHVPRTVTHFVSCLPGNRDPAFFHPFPPSRYEAYRHRTRLFRTQNDVFMTINQRPEGRIDSSAFGTLDISGRTTGGAFHPTAEAHVIIANQTAPLLCDAIGCGQ